MVRTVIVVGAGTSGSIITRRLVDAGIEVTLIEAGGTDSNPAIHDPSRAAELWHASEDWDFYTVPQEHAAHRELHLPRGKVVGGSHALNAMIWVRGAASDYDHWEAAGAEGWGWDAVRPVFEQLENDLLPVTDGYPLDAIQASLIEAAVQEGLAHNPNYNGDTLDGISQQQVTMRDGRRVNTWMAYVEPVREAKNLTVITDEEVHSVRVESGRAVGVRIVGASGERELRADEVILAAGAIGSPAILLRSGIGPRADLTQLGIDVVRDLPAVGDNLHDHLLSPVIFTTSTRMVDPPRSGTSVTQTHLFWRSRPDLDEPDTQPINFSVPMWDEQLTPRGESGFTMLAGLVRPYSRGSLRLSGPNLDDPLLLDLAALQDDRDAAALAASVRQCRSIGRQPALADEWGAVEVYPGPEVADADVEDWVRRTAITYHHQVGTCRMGGDDASVVDPQLRVRGVAGLRVVDASVMPRITSGNTNAPAAMIGERGASFILADVEDAVAGGARDEHALKMVDVGD